MSENKFPDLSHSSPGKPGERDERVTAGHFALEIMHELRNPLETLINLNYLILNAAELLLAWAIGEPAFRQNQDRPLTCRNGLQESRNRPCYCHACRGARHVLSHRRN